MKNNSDADNIDWMILS